MYNLHAEVSSGPFAFHLYCLHFHDRNLKFDFDASFLTLIWIQIWRFISNFLIEFDFEASFPSSYSNSTSKLCSQIIVRTRVQTVVSQVSFKVKLEFEASLRNSCSNFNSKLSFRIVVLIVNWKWSFKFDQKFVNEAWIGIRIRIDKESTKKWETKLRIRVEVSAIVQKQSF